MDVHYEWYRRRTFFQKPQSGRIAPQACFGWMTVSSEDEPLLRLPLLLEPLVSTGATNVSLIGPRRSSTLRAMLPGPLAGTKPLRDANPNLWALATNLSKVLTFTVPPPAQWTKCR